MKLTAFEIWDGSDLTLPALIARIPAGEPMELGDEIEMVDLNYLLTKGSPDSILLKVEGDSMCPEVSDGDWIVVSRSLPPQMDDMCVCSVNGEHTLKRLRKDDLKAKLYLVPTNGSVTIRELQPTDEFSVIGTVTRIIHCVK